ncbi:MAG: YdcH family protein [Acidobacteriota bacterium]|nr:YdcH family protein [Acidobacteriota bacterium]
MHTRKQAKARLIETDQTFRSLYEAHQIHERRLDDLHDSYAATDCDEVQLKTLKIEKLRLKDRMEQIIQSHLDAPTPAH